MESKSISKYYDECMTDSDYNKNRTERNPPDNSNCVNAVIGVINKMLKDNQHRNAFIMLIMVVGRLESEDKDKLTNYYYQHLFNMNNDDTELKNR